MTKSPLLVVNLALKTAGALSLAFDGSRSAGCSLLARLDGAGVAAPTVAAPIGAADAGAAAVAGGGVAAAADVDIGSGSLLEQHAPPRAMTTQRSEAFMARS